MKVFPVAVTTAQLVVWDIQLALYSHLSIYWVGYFLLNVIFGRWG